MWTLSCCALLRRFFSLLYACVCFVVRVCCFFACTYLVPVFLFFLGCGSVVGLLFRCFVFFCSSQYLVTVYLCVVLLLSHVLYAGAQHGRRGAANASGRSRVRRKIGGRRHHRQRHAHGGDNRKTHVHGIVPGRTGERGVYDMYNGKPSEVPWEFPRNIPRECTYT